MFIYIMAAEHTAVQACNNMISFHQHTIDTQYLTHEGEMWVSFVNLKHVICAIFTNAAFVIALLFAKLYLLYTMSWLGVVIMGPNCVFLPMISALQPVIWACDAKEDHRLSAVMMYCVGFISWQMSRWW